METQKSIAKPVFTSRRMEQQWVRMQAVKMIDFGMTVSNVARFFQVTTRAVFKWISASLSGEPPGSPVVCPQPPRSPMKSTIFALEIVIL